ncbi:DEAD/DEAH box helicase [Cyanobium sp. Lug-B]|uniref:DEAD/DEAH box helicase n=1 Tax=Cyanobium sp. Lug-B TaxID=2823716 RepID=UPI0028F44DC2|nr:DEAD/DEAH box helicase [Cyanobium sp. Lug-B]
MAFNTKRRVAKSYDTHEALFRDRRNRMVQGLLSHQSDILRKYQNEALEKPNVAIELPTGSGKTLVGLLIAEYKRITNGERVLYLCPTKQLVQQVCLQSMQKYGIHAIPFIGRKKDYEQSAKASYLNAETIAVAPYSALFNTNPFFVNPQLIVLDDAHAAENYISMNWSVNISRVNDAYVYDQLLGIILRHMPSTEMTRFKSSAEDMAKWVEVMPGHLQARSQEEICEFLNQHLGRESDQYYSWSLIQSYLHACQIYISNKSILIRPLIPPSLTHAPFADAAQRVYMSATLGLTGDLERITGIDTFYRIPIPHGWDKQGIGRRLFMFPELSLESNQAEVLVRTLAEQAGRAVVLTPDTPRVEKWKKVFNRHTIFTASDIEDSIDKFCASPHAIAILANRYDGLDFLDESCRLLVLDGLPKAVNLQESFQITRMMAGNLFKDRIRTRIVQAVGRCTRSATDYAAVVVVGEDFFDWLVVNEKLSLFHPELQGELKFGIQQKDVDSVDEFSENMAMFLTHGEDWDQADAYILEMRDETTQATIPGQDKLLSAAVKEVRYAYTLWDGNYRKALELAEAVADTLTGNELKGLRGQWYYQAAVCADKLVTDSNATEYHQKTIDLYRRAAACLPALAWLHARIIDLTGKTDNEMSSEKSCSFLEANIERMENVFADRGYSSIRRFEQDIKSIGDMLRSTDSDQFEEAHRLLGEILGFQSENSTGHAAPDPWWISTAELCIVFEDKSDSNPDNAVPVNTVRQAVSHPKWIRGNTFVNNTAAIYSSLITTQRKIHRDVPTYADELGYWHIDDFIDFSSEVFNVLRDLRASFVGIGDTSWRDVARQLLKEKCLDPVSIINRATMRKLRQVTVE